MLIKREKMYLELLLSRYYQYPKLIAMRRAELSVREVDENIGGGKSNIPGRPIENLVIKWTDDEYLRRLEREYQALTDTLAQLGDSERRVIELWYFENQGLNTWEDVAAQTHYSKSRIYRIRDNVLEIFGNLAGICNTMTVKEWKK